MEEVIGSIPIRSTNQIKHLATPPTQCLVAFLPQIPRPFPVEDCGPLGFEAAIRSVV
jgi:hypothetical protein